LFLERAAKHTGWGQHDNVSWFDLEEIKDDDNFHKYMQTYASWLNNKDIQK